MSQNNPTSRDEHTIQILGGNHCLTEILAKGLFLLSIFWSPRSFSLLYLVFSFCMFLFLLFFCQYILIFKKETELEQATTVISTISYSQPKKKTMTLCCTIFRPEEKSKFLIIVRRVITWVSGSTFSSFTSILHVFFRFPYNIFQLSCNFFIELQINARY